MVKGSQHQQAAEERMSGGGGHAGSVTSLQSQPTKPAKKKRGLPGNPDPEAEVVALSPRTLMATNRFVCEICNKGFQRDQNLQLHRRGHNLPWKLKQRASKEAPPRKKVYICPEPSCVHHDPARALGDLTGVKKHFSRKHGEKKWKCDRCSKKYAVHSDWKAHTKICGTREYRCDCGTLFSRRDSFITHRAFCDALAAEETARSSPAAAVNSFELPASAPLGMKEETDVFSSQMMMRSQALHPNTSMPAAGSSAPSPYLSATALLQKAAQMGAIMGTGSGTASAGLTSGRQGAAAAAGCSAGAAPRGRRDGAPPPAEAAAGFRTPDAVLLRREQMGEAGRSFAGAGPMAAAEREEGSGGGALQLTRDFLGKRRAAVFSRQQDNILDMARLDPCNNNMRSSSSKTSHAPWS